MNDLLLSARIDVVDDLATSLVDAAAKVLTVHGDDPENHLLLAAGFAHALQSMGKHIDWRIPEATRVMLNNAKEREDAKRK